MSSHFNLPDGFNDALSYAKNWCSENQLAVGVGEMAIGAALVAWGLQSGATLPLVCDYP